MTEPQVLAALEKTPKELRPLLIWLVTGKMPGPNALNGTK